MCVVKRLGLHVCILTAFLLFGASSGFAGETVPCAAMRPVYTGELPPYTMKDNDGSFNGIAVDTLKAIATAMGCPLTDAEFHSVSWPRALADVENGQHGMIFSLGKTAAREEHFRWVGPIGSLRLGLIARKDRHIRIHTIKDLQRYRIGVIRHSAPEQMLAKYFEGSKESFTELVSNEQQFGMLAKGRVDMITHSASATPSLMQSMNIDPSDYEMVFVLKELDLFFALSPTVSPETARQIQQQLDALKRPIGNGQSAFDSIVSRYRLPGKIGFPPAAEGLH